MDKEKIDAFFRGEPVKYEVKRGKIEADLTIQHQVPSEWKWGIDHLCYVDLNIRFIIGYTGTANRNPSLTWKPAYLRVESRSLTYYGGLFEQMHHHTNSFCDMLAHGSAPSVHELRRLFDTLEDKFREDFDNKEFEEHFRMKGPIPDD